jgi:phage-related protein
MAPTADLRLQPDDVSDATARLDKLAERAAQLMHGEAANLTVTASGRDEVSQRVASTLNQVHDTFTGTTDQATTQIHGMAATLRSHADNVVAAEQEFMP